MEKKIQKTFNIEAWKNGARVETREGYQVKILCADAKLPDGNTIVGLVDCLDERIGVWDKDGLYWGKGDYYKDLVIVEEIEEPERWADDKDALGDGYYVNHHYSRVYKLSEIELNRVTNYCFFATEKQAKSALAMARISQLITYDARFGGVVTDAEWRNTEITKYIIGRDWSGLIYTTSYIYALYTFLAFHTSEQRDRFLKENERLVKDYLMID